VAGQIPLRGCPVEHLAGRFEFGLVIWLKIR